MKNIWVSLILIFTSYSSVVFGEDPSCAKGQGSTVCRENEIWAKTQTGVCKCNSTEGENNHIQGCMESGPHAYYDTEKNKCYSDSGSHAVADSPARTTDTSTSSGPTVWGATCEKDLEAATDYCDSEKNGLMNQAVNGANELLKRPQVDLQMACSQWGTVSQSAEAGLASYKAYCAMGFNTCSASCDADVEAVKAARAHGTASTEDVQTVTTNRGKCQALQRNIGAAVQNIQGFSRISAQMEKCQSLIVPTFAQQCAKDPTNPLCKMAAGTDCSNPQVKVSNLVCKCNDNPGMAECPHAIPNGPVAGKANYGSAAGADGLNNGQNLGAFGGLGGGFGNGGLGPGSEGKPEQPDGRSLNRGGSGKANVSENGGGNNKPPGKDTGGGGSGLNAKTITGYGFGSNGSTGGGTSGSNSIGTPYGGNGHSNVRGQNPDLTQFLPGGGRDPRRALAGISGPDGITGPNSNIWQKINIRYFSISHSLLP